MATKQASTPALASPSKNSKKKRKQKQAKKKPVEPLAPPAAAATPQAPIDDLTIKNSLINADNAYFDPVTQAPAATVENKAAKDLGIIVSVHDLLLLVDLHCCVQCHLRSFRTSPATNVPVRFATWFLQAGT
jgi:hypothetical protein